MGSKQKAEIRVSSTVEGVEFIYEDTNIKRGNIKLYKSNESNTVELGRSLFPDHQSISRTHARLTFEDFKVSIIDLGSVFGTWVQSKKGCLVKNKPHTLEDGDRIVFGAEEDRGRTKDPDAVRVRVKFLTEPPPRGTAKSTPPSPKGKDDGKKTPSPSPKAANKELLEAPDSKSKRPSTPETNLQSPRGTDDRRKTPSPSPKAVKRELLEAPKSKPKRPGTPETNHKRPPIQRRRTSSLGAQEKPQRLTASFAIPSARPANLQTPHTILDKYIKIPWSEVFRPGFGVNALTGDFVAASALRPFKLEDKAKPGKSRTSVERLQWKGVKELRDEFQMELGATMNLPCPLGANSKIASVISENTATSTILIQYKVEADFAPEFIPVGVQLKAGLEKLPDKEFREKFGDYYIAGCRRSYSCRMIVVCKINEQTVTERHEKEAAALVDRYFKGSIKAVDVEQETTSVSLLSVIVDAEGCSADPSNVFSVAVEDATKTLSKVLKNAPGVPRVAYLYHYSSLDSCKLSRRVEVSRDMFNKASSMREVYAHLQASLLHPALATAAPDRRTIHAVLRRFEDQRRSIVHAIKGDKRVEALERDLAIAKGKTDALVRRYEFIRIVRDMDKGVVAHSPTLVDGGGDGGGMYLYRWDCGRTGAAKKVTALKAYNLVSFDPGAYKAFELEWQTPMTDGTSTLQQLLRRGTPREVVSFRTQSSGQGRPPLPLPVPPSPSRKLVKLPPAGATGKRQSEPDTNGDGVFNFVLADHQPCYILGWSLSCYWPEGKGKLQPAIDVDNHPTNFILSDRLQVFVDNSRAARWHCKVTFVIQTSYNFPDLLV